MLPYIITWKNTDLPLTNVFDGLSNGGKTFSWAIQIKLIIIDGETNGDGSIICQTGSKC